MLPAAKRFRASKAIGRNVKLWLEHEDERVRVAGQITQLVVGWPVVVRNVQHALAGCDLFQNGLKRYQIQRLGQRVHARENVLAGEGAMRIKDVWRQTAGPCPSRWLAKERVLPIAGQPRHQFRSVAVGHINVAEDQVERLFAQGLFRLASVCRCMGIHGTQTVEQVTGYRTLERMVFDDQDSQGFELGGHGAFCDGRWRAKYLNSTELYEKGQAIVAEATPFDPKFLGENAEVSPRQSGAICPCLSGDESKGDAQDENNRTDWRHELGVVGRVLPTDQPGDEDPPGRTQECP
jgi:hypothetical protein